MEPEYDFRIAKQDDINRIWEIIQQAKMQMYWEKKQQWDDSYPTFEHIATDIDNQYAYVLCYENHIIAYGAVVFDEEPAYRTIKGKWLSNCPYVVLHRLAVAEEMRQRGIATVFMHEVEKLSIRKGVYSFRADTNFDNFSMQKVFENCGFTYCDDISYQGGSRIAFEKSLK